MLYLTVLCHPLLYCTALHCNILYIPSSLTSSAGKENFNIEYSSGERVRVWPDLLDRNDGSYIARFKLMSTYRDLTISIKFKNQHVANSPYHLRGLFPAYDISILHILPLLGIKNFYLMW